MHIVKDMEQLSDRNMHAKKWWHRKKEQFTTGKRQEDSLQT